MPEPLKVQWSAAEVKDGTLTVTLDAKPPKQWRGAFETTAVLLGRDRLAVAISSGGKITVATVEPGDEDRVREFVEGAVLQANSTIVDEDELFGTDSSDEHDEDSDDDGDDSAASGDEELTDRFRAFADDDEDDEDDEDEQ